MAWQQVGGPATAIGTAVTGAVAAARAADADAFGTAVEGLRELDPRQVQRVMGTVVRALLEDLHPDGISGDDLQIVLERTAWAARPWWPAVKPAALAALLLGAMGMLSEDDTPPPGDLLSHGVLLTTVLLGQIERGLDPYLERAYTDIAHAELDGP